MNTAPLGQGQSVTLDHRFPINLLARSPVEVRQRLAWNDFVLREAVENGLIMYESADCRAVRKEARLSLALPV